MYIVSLQHKDRPKAQRTQGELRKCEVPPNKSSSIPHFLHTPAPDTASIYGDGRRAWAKWNYVVFSKGIRASPP